jgi:hypothetical protein
MIDLEIKIPTSEESANSVTSSTRLHIHCFCVSKMVFQSCYFENLSVEIKLNIVSFLPAKHAATLRLVCRSWREPATEGLFNVYTRTGVVPTYPGYTEFWPFLHWDEQKEEQGFITSGILIIRPWRSYSTILDGLIQWPHMLRLIKEVEIFLPDKRMDEVFRIVDDAMAMRQQDESGDRDLPWPKGRFLNLGSNISDMEFNLSLIGTLFSRLSHVEALSIFSERCPFLESESLLYSAWNDFFLWHEEGPVESFGNYYQDFALASIQYSRILQNVMYFKSRIKKLHFDSVPFKVFEELYETVGSHVDDVGESSDIFSRVKLSNRFIWSFKNVRELHLVIVMDSLNEVASTILGSSAVSQFIGTMSELRNLSLVWSDKHGNIPPSSHSQYLFTWNIWQSALFRNYWPKLKIFRLQDLLTPDILLLQFLLKHAHSLRKASLTGYFLVKDEGMSWGPLFQEDNVRQFLMSLREKATLEEIQIRFSTRDGTVYEPTRAFYDKRWDKIWAFSNLDWKAISTNLKEVPKSLIDHHLLNLFLHGLCPWPMIHDRPQNICGLYQWVRLLMSAEILAGPEQEFGDRVTYLE